MKALSRADRRDGQDGVSRIGRLFSLQDIWWWVLFAFFWLWLGLACLPDWRRSEDYSFGFAVIPLAVYFLIVRLGPVRGLPDDAVVRWLPAFLFFLVVAAGVLELFRQAPVYWRFFLWAIYAVVAAASVSLLYLLGGKRWVRSGAFPILLIGVAVPWPTVVEYQLTMGMMELVAGWVAGILPMLGFPALRQGTTIMLETCVVGVEEACSGIRSLQLSVFLGLVAGEWVALRWPWRVLWVFVSMILAVILNGFRTLWLALAAVHGGEDGIAANHDPAGNTALLLLVVLIFVGGWMLRLLTARTPDTSTLSAQAPDAHTEDFSNAKPMPTRNRPALVLLGVFLVGLAGAHGWFLWHERIPAPDVPVVVISSDERLSQKPLTPLLQAALNPTTGSTLRWADGPASDPGYHFFWDSSRDTLEALYHRPDSCMPGGGWKSLAGEDVVRTGEGDTAITWRAIPYERNGATALLLWSAWMDGQPVPPGLHAHSGVQRAFLWQSVCQGRRRFSYEVAAVMIPFTGDSLPLARAREVAEAIFHHQPVP